MSEIALINRQVWMLSFEASLILTAEATHDIASSIGFTMLCKMKVFALNTDYSVPNCGYMYVTMYTPCM